MDKVSFILGELAKVASARGLEKIGNKIRIKCPQHKGGMEAHPSLSINIDANRAAVGAFNCLACNFHGGWNLLAETLGLQGFTREKTYVKKAYPLAIKTGNTTPERLPSRTVWPVEKEWRTISGKLISNLGGVRLFPNKTDERLLLPAYVNNILRGWISCSLDGSDPKYLYVAGEWIKKTLFPYDYVYQRWYGQPVYIVEGPRDALNMIQNNTPALAILGSTSWSIIKRLLLVALGCPAVFLALDPDEAGEKARKTIQKDVDPYIKTFPILLPTVGKTKIDPGGLTPGSIQQLNSIMFAKLAQRQKRPLVFQDIKLKS